VLIETVRRWRADLPQGHGVSAVVVVHVAVGRDLVLPAAGLDLSWTSAGDAVGAIRAQISDRTESPSLAAVAALIAATVGEVATG
jgi:ribose/xylose/arabinose/galactoside ABC-type transport system permease subunit